MDGQKWIHYRPTKIPCYLETLCPSTFYKRSTTRFLSQEEPLHLPQQRRLRNTNSIATTYVLHR
jgi:hypothetical protein